MPSAASPRPSSLAPWGGDVARYTGVALQLQALPGLVKGFPGTNGLPILYHLLHCLATKDQKCGHTFLVQAASNSAVMNPLYGVFYTKGDAAPGWIWPALLKQTPLHVQVMSDRLIHPLLVAKKQILLFNGSRVSVQGYSWLLPSLHANF